MRFLAGVAVGLGAWAAAEWWRNPMGTRGRKIPVAYHRRRAEASTNGGVVRLRSVHFRHPA